MKRYEAFEVEICGLCGRQRQYGMTAYCRGGIGRQRHERRPYEKVEYVPATTTQGAVEDRRIMSHALTLALKPHVRDVSAAKDALIKRAAEDLQRGQS